MTPWQTLPIERFARIFHKQRRIFHVTGVHDIPSGNHLIAEAVPGQCCLRSHIIMDYADWVRVGAGDNPELGREDGSWSCCPHSSWLAAAAGLIYNQNQSIMLIRVGGWSGDGFVFSR